MTNLASLREQKELRYAKKGLALALMSGMIWSSDGLILGKGLAEEPFGSPALWLFAPLSPPGSMTSAPRASRWRSTARRARAGK